MQLHHKTFFSFNSMCGLVWNIHMLPLPLGNAKVELSILKKALLRGDKYIDDVSA